MATRYKIKAVDDHLYDREEMINFLKSTDDDIVLWTKGEGFSLYQCGLIDILTELDMLDRVSIETPNYVEQLPIKYTQEPPKISHWFYSCREKFDQGLSDRISGERFHLGCFIGRRNIDRLSILYWLWNKHSCLLSLMQDGGTYTETPDIDSWINNKISFDSWINEDNIKSLDNARVLDQYQEGNFLTPQLNLLQYYDQFDVELVCESFVRGDTFFPTEKTVRPIIGKKPMVIYGPKNYLKHLKALGFKTWDTIWDESYDEYEGIERWKLMQKVIDQIHFWGDWEWKLRLEQAQKIADYNFDHFLNITTL